MKAQKNQQNNYEPSPESVMIGCISHSDVIVSFIL
jgi:hypothetical protein